MKTRAGSSPALGTSYYEKLKKILNDPYSSGIVSDLFSSNASSISGASNTCSVLSVLYRYAKNKVRTSHKAARKDVSLPKKLDGPKAPNIELDEPPPKLILDPSLFLAEEELTQ